MNANILAVDTSSRVLSIAIRRGKEAAVFETNLEGTPRHSEQMIDLIQLGLARLGLKKNDLDLFLWGLGPGSFTGLRIGLSILKGFHFGFGKRSFGASSLDLIALGSGLTSGELAVCVDARREHIYAAIYRFQNGAVKKVLRDSVISPDQLMKRVKERTVFVGDALATYGDLIRKRLGKNALFLPASFWYPRAVFLTHLYEMKRD
ncbi:MAG: tRNA (adenosine(37)-N6)-threonylcarbamoyltransferase complex dimerization subunit type 1 TsaB, partial [Candidatus Omnitrophica bacterium]|nr:tRNA (adenosine(37)-N6)-threonylcarbamoyltransferase complex dimerization subunit type 1 TsaB [Candidatus Omnitrophota bacterium]